MEFKRKNILFIFLIITVCQLILDQFGYFDTDFGDYKYQINKLLKGSWDIGNRYVPATSIVYSGFIWVFNKKFGIIFLHSFLFTLIVQQLNKIIQELGGRKNPSFIISLLVSLFPFGVIYISRGVNSELFFIFVSANIFYLLLAKRINFQLAFWVALSILIRPVGIFYIPIIIIIGVLTRENFYHLVRKTMILGLSVFLLISPWLFYSYKSTGNILSSGFKPSFRDGFTFNNKKMRNYLDLPEEVEDFSQSFYTRYYKNKDVHRDDEYQFVLNYLVTNPVTTLRIFGYKFLRTWYGTDSQNRNIELVNIIIIIPTLLSLIYIIIKPSNNIEYYYILLLTSILLLSSFLSTFVLSILRYQSVFLPFLHLVVLQRSYDFIYQIRVKLTK